MGMFMSREKLLFTHKPLAMQNNCAPAESYQKGAGKTQKPLAFLHFSAFLIYSHSIVAGGLPVMSYTTRPTPLTSLTMRAETMPRTL